MQLSRFTIIGGISCRVPLCVLEEISEAHGIPLNNKEAFLSSGFTIPDPLRKEDLPLVASFVNPKEKWTAMTLLNACQWLCSFSDGRGLERISLPLHIGPQTAKEPKKLNACVLYRLCCDGGLGVHPKMSLEEMGLSITLLKSYSLAPLNIMVTSQRVSGPLLSLLLQRKTSPKIGEGAYERIWDLEALELVATTFKPLIKTNATIKLPFIPIDEHQAIYFAALNYHCDLTQAESPLLEYCLLSSVGFEGYQPHDVRLSLWKRKNPMLLDLRETFNPYLPESYYPDIYRLLNKEGIAKSETQQCRPIELMQTAYLSCTFYEGWQSKVKATYTCITREDLNDVDPQLLLGFGMKDDGLFMISYEELAAHFNNLRLFSNPSQNREYFEDKAIRKLKDLCIKPSNHQKQKEDRLALLSVILSIEEEGKGIQLTFNLFHHKYELSSDSEKSAMEELIISLFYVSMYMRGWKGPNSQYPIAIVPLVDGEEVDIRVAEALAIFDILCKRYPSQSKELLSLPLVYYSKSYLPSTDIEDGRTVGERLEIVKEGDKSNKEAACIRLSSNWFAFSCNRAYQAIGKGELFPPSSLRAIR